MKMLAGSLSLVIMLLTLHIHTQEQSLALAKMSAKTLTLQFGDMQLVNKKSKWLLNGPKQSLNARDTELLIQESRTLHDMLTESILSNDPEPILMPRQYVDPEEFKKMLSLLPLNKAELVTEIGLHSPEEIISLIVMADYLAITKLQSTHLSPKTMLNVATYYVERPDKLNKLPKISAFDTMLLDKPLLLFTLQGHTDFVVSVAWSPDGTKLATGSPGKTERIWDANTGEIVHTLQGHTDFLTSVAWSPDGTKLATASRDNTARIWNASTGEIVHTLGHTDSVQSVAWSPDGTKLATASADNTVRIWNANTGEIVHTLQGHTKAVWSIAWSPDGTKLATASADNTARIWNASTGEIVHTLGHTKPVNSKRSVAWSPDGTKLATASADKTARIWNATTGEIVHTLQGHTNVVVSVAWSPDGTKLATASADKTARIWLIKTNHNLNIAQALLVYYMAETQKVPPHLADYIQLIQSLPKNITASLKNSIPNFDAQIAKAKVAAAKIELRTSRTLLKNKILLEQLKSKKQNIISLIKEKKKVDKDDPSILLDEQELNTVERKIHELERAISSLPTPYLIPGDRENVIIPDALVPRSVSPNDGFLTRMAKKLWSIFRK